MSRKRAAGGNLAASIRRSQAPKLRLIPKLKQLYRQYPEIMYNFAHSWALVKLFICIEVVMNYFIIRQVKYTEIDWSTYMAQVGMIFNSTKPNFDYTSITGPTGPLVYPAGHTYVFYLLRELTEGGTNLQSAQTIFMLIYIAQLTMVYKIYSHKRVVKVPPYVFAIVCFTSYRIHSIYVLRLFNDPIAVLVAYASFYALLEKKHLISSILFSFAISIKMNILLYAPAYALVYYENLGILKSIKFALVALSTQVLLAAPYLYVNPWGYLHQAFNFGRVFLYKWTVNWRFLDEKTFTSPRFFVLLLGLHVAFLFLIFWKRWLSVVLPRRFAPSVRRDDPILTLFITNFVGIAFSRSLHYQFYVWYYHSLPMLLWATNYSIMARLLIAGCIEYAWNTYPSSQFSSYLLLSSHAAIYLGLLTRHWKRNSAK